tara:strand:- start:156 stop:839 length:684 start_codon:yes stop_codon:yes gene_type:complete
MQYPSISKTPEKVLTHLLFCNGNGCEIEDGNFVQYFDYGMCVPYSEMYKRINTSSSIIERSNDRYFDCEVEKLYESKVSFEKRMCTILDKPFNEDLLWSECSEEFRGRYDRVDLVDKYSLSDLQNKDTYIRQLNLGEYSPYLSLSSKYYKAYFFNENTDKDLLKITIALAEAYVETLSNFIEEDYPVTWAKPVGSMSKLDYDKLYNRDITQLRGLITRLNTLITKGE